MYITDKELDQLLEDCKQTSQYTKEEFMAKCPGVFPSCDEEVIWYEAWLSNNKTEVDKAHQQHCQQQAAEYFNHKLFLRDFLERNSVMDHGTFLLEYNNGVASIIAPDNKETFKIEIIPEKYRNNG